MAEAGLVIQLRNLSPFKDELNNLDKVLSDLDKRLDGLAATFNKLQGLNKSFVANFAKLTNSIRALNRAGDLRARSKDLLDLGNSLRVLSTSLAGLNRQGIANLRTLANAINRFGQLQNPSSVINNINRYASAFNKLALSTASLASSNVNVRAITRFVEEIAKLGNLRLGKAANIKSFETFVNSIKSLFNILRDIQPLQTSAVFESISVGSEIDVTKDVERFRLNLDAITSVLRQLNNIAQLVSSTRGINRRQLNSVTEFIKGIGDLFRVLPNVDPAVAQSAASSISAIKRILSELDFGSSGGILSSGLNLLGSAFSRLTGLTANRDLNGFINAIRTLANGLKILDQIQSPGRLRAVGNVTRAILDLIKDFRDIPVSGLNRFLGLFGRSTRLSSALQGFANFTRVLARALQPLTQLPRVSALSSIGNFLRSILNLLPVLKEIQENTPQPRALNRVLSVFGRNTELSRFLSGFSNFIRVIARSVNELRRVNVDTTKLVSISRFVEGVGNIISAISKGDFNRSSVQEFQNAIQGIVNAISTGLSRGIKGVDLSKVGVDAGQDFIDGMENVLEISSPSRVMIRIGGDIVNGLRLGIVNTLPRLTALPRRIIQPLISGLSRASGPISRVARNIATSFLNAFRSAFDFGFNQIIRGTLNQISRLGSAANNQLRSIGQNLRSTASNLFRGGLTAVTSGGIAGFLQGQAVQLTAGFDQILNSIQVFGRLSNEQLESVRSTLLDFSAATIFDPTQTANAFLGLQKAGLSAGEALSSIVDVGNLAAAANIDLAAATDIAIRAANAFGISYDDLTQVVDSFVGAADISTAEVDQLGQALGFVGNDAAALGVPINDVAAALALLNDRGIAAERAGTGLRQVFASLSNPTERAQNALDQLGVSVFDASGEFVGLESLLQQFQGAIEGLSTEELNQLLGSIGDRNAVSALKALVSAADDGSLAFEQYAEELENANTAEFIAAEAADTARGRFISLAGSIQALFIRALTPLLNNVFKPLAEFLIDLVNSIGELPEEILAVAAGVGIFVTALITLGGAASVLAGIFLFTLVPAITTFSVALSIFLNPLALITGIGLITAAFASLLPVFLAVGGAIAIVTVAIQDIRNNVGGAGDAFDRFKDSLSGLFDAVSAFGQALLGLLGILFDFDASAGQSGITSFLDAITEKVEAFTRTLNDLTLAFDFFKAGLDLLNFNPDDIAADGGRTEEINNLLKEREELLKNVAEQAENAGERTVVAGDNLSKIARDLNIDLQDLIDANPQIEDPSLIFPGQIINIPIDGANLEEIDPAIQNEIDRIDNEINLRRKGLDLGEEVRAPVRELSRLQSAFARALTSFAATPLFTALFGDFSEQSLQTAIDSIGRLEQRFERIRNTIRGVLGGVRTIFGGDFSQGINEIVTGLSNLSLELLDIASILFGFNIGEELRAALLGGDIGAIVSLGVRTLGNAILDGIQSILPGVARSVASLVASIFTGIPRILFDLFGLDFLDGFLDFFSDLTKVVINGLGSVINNAISALRRNISLEDAIGEILDDVTGFIENSETFSNISKFFTNTFDSIGKSLSDTSFSGVADFFTDIFSGIRDFDAIGAFNNAVENIERNLNKLPGTLKKISREFRNLFRKEPKAAFKEISNGFRDIFDSVVQAGESLFGFELSQILDRAFGVGGIGTELVNIGLEIVNLLLDGIEAAAPFLGEGIGAILGGVFGRLPRLLLNFLGVDELDGIFNFIEDLGNVIGVALGSTLGNVISLIQGDISVGEALNNIFGDIGAEIENSPVLQQIADLFSFVDIDFVEVENSIKSFFENITTDISNLLSSEEFQTNLSSFVSNLTELKDLLIDLGTSGADTGVGILEDLFNFFTSGEFQNAISRLSPLLNVFTGTIDDVKESFDELQDIDVGGIETLVGALAVLGGGFLAFGGITIILAGVTAALAAFNVAIAAVLVGVFLFRAAIAALPSVIQILSGLGDVLLGILQADPDRIAKGLGDIAEGIGGIVEAITGAALSTATDFVQTLADLAGLDIDVADRVAQAIPLLEFLDILLTTFVAGLKLAFLEIIQGVVRLSLVVADAINGIIGSLPDAVQAELGISEIDVSALENTIDGIEEEQREIKFTARADILGFDSALAERLETEQVTVEDLRVRLSDNPQEEFREEALEQINNALEVIEDEEIRIELEQLAFELDPNASFQLPSGEFIPIEDLNEQLAGGEVTARDFEIKFRDPEISEQTRQELLGELEEAIEQSEDEGVTIRLRLRQLELDPTAASISGSLVSETIDVDDVVNVAIESPELRDEIIQEIDSAIIDAELALLEGGDAARFEPLLIELQDARVTLGDIQTDQEIANTLFDTIDADLEEQFFNLPAFSVNLSPEEEAEIVNAYANVINDALAAGFTEEQIQIAIGQTGVLVGDDTTGQQAFDLRQQIVDSLLGVDGEVGFGTTFSDIGVSVTDGIVQGISDGQEDISAAGDETVNTLRESLDTGLEIQSPSQVTFRMGRDVILGLVMGIQTNLPLVQVALSLIANEFDTLETEVKQTGIVIQSSMTQAAVSMNQNAIIIQSAANQMVLAFNNITNAAGDAAVAAGQVAGAVANVATSTGGTTTSAAGAAVGSLPAFQGGGFTGSGANPFLAVLHPEEFVVPQNGALVLRDSDTLRALRSVENILSRPSFLPAVNQNGFTGSRNDFGIPNVNNTSSNVSITENIQIFVEGDQVNDTILEQSVQRALDNSDRDPLFVRAQEAGLL